MCAHLIRWGCLVADSIGLESGSEHGDESRSESIFRIWQSRNEPRDFVAKRDWRRLESLKYKIFFKKRGVAREGWGGRGSTIKWPVNTALEAKLEMSWVQLPEGYCFLVLSSVKQVPIVMKMAYAWCRTSKVWSVNNHNSQFTAFKNLPQSWVDKAPISHCHSKKSWNTFYTDLTSHEMY